jgi:hypothetical protein
MKPPVPEQIKENQDKSGTFPRELAPERGGVDTVLIHLAVQGLPANPQGCDLTTALLCSAVDENLDRGG